MKNIENLCKLHKLVEVIYLFKWLVRFNFSGQFERVIYGGPIGHNHVI